MSRGKKVRPLAPRQIIERLSVLYGEPVWRQHGDAMTELVLTILSQNTSDTNSGRAFMRLRLRFATWEELLAADASQIESEIAVGGLARVKAPRIKAILKEVWQRCASFDISFLREMPLDNAKEWLRSLPGVGPKTAACVLMFALGRAALPVDTHVHRVAQRLGLVPAKTGAAQSHDLLEAMLTPEEVYPFHISLIKHGRRICRAQRPLCNQCPLLDGCPAGSKFVSTTSRVMPSDALPPDEQPHHAVSDHREKAFSD
jgi:endonuclease-3